MMFDMKTTQSINSRSCFEVFLHITFFEDAHITAYNVVNITNIILSKMKDWYTYFASQNPSGHTNEFLSALLYMMLKWSKP
jgi:hypothetical protein